MNPEDKKKQLLETFKRVKEENVDTGLKSMNEIDIEIDEKVIDWWLNNK